MIDAAIIGLGRWGQRLVDSVQGKSERIRFVAAATGTPDKAREYAATHGLVLTDYAAILANPAIRAVVLATPHRQHADQVIEAARARRHVFVEKPFTLTRASAIAAAEACRKAGVVLALGHNRRFLPATEDLKRLIAGGGLGTILHADANYSSMGGFRYQAGAWRADPAESPAGGMTGLGIHMVDALINLIGPIAEVDARSQRRVLTIPLDDTTTMLLRFADGASGTLTTIQATAPLWRLQVFGSQGWAEMRGHETLVIQLRDREQETRQYPVIDMERAELEAFAAAAEGGPAYPLPPEQAVHGVAVLEAVIASAKAAAKVPVAG